MKYYVLHDITYQGIFTLKQPKQSNSTTLTISMNIFLFRHDGTWLLCAIPTYTIPPKIHRPRLKKRKKEVNNSVSNHILSSSSFTHKHTSLAFISFIHTPEASIARLMPSLHTPTSLYTGSSWKWELLKKKTRWANKAKRVNRAALRLLFFFIKVVKTRSLMPLRSSLSNRQKN